jgi:hypothetical protein
MFRPALCILLLTLACAPKQIAFVEPDPQSELEAQKERAAEPGRNQVLEQVRLASMAMAMGMDELADNTLTTAALQMQDFRADGAFRATVGVESAKEWKGEPFEKMMGFLYLAQWRYQRGDYSNALAMTKQAILADTGTSRDQYRADFIPAFVLQALCFEALYEHRNAERSIQVAVDGLWARALTDALTQTLSEAQLDDSQHDPSEVAAAKVLLLGGLPVGLRGSPRDPERAIELALSWAADARSNAVSSKRSDWPEALSSMKKSDLRKAFDHLAPLAHAWVNSFESLDDKTLAQLASDEAFLLDLLDDPGVLLWVETGWGPAKVAEGRYGEVLTLRPRQQGQHPAMTLDGHHVDAHYLDSVTWQATTRGGRVVDGFLKGKAVFKDSAGILGFSLLVAGDMASYSDDDGPVGTILTIAGAVLYIAGALTNPRADVRAWDMLPDAIFLVRLDPEPGSHNLAINGRNYTLEVPEKGAVVRWLPRLPPGGPKTIGPPATGGTP